MLSNLSLKQLSQNKFKVNFKFVLYTIIFKIRYIFKNGYKLIFLSKQLETSFSFSFHNVLLQNVRILYDSISKQTILKT